ncbi:MAG: glycerophosphoryl diester phosphodiesterase membrane domain-containing protein [Sphingomonadaceae bacterium]|nr:glycerophosphoryl diester phosphodiesterase membrane domain-containing protein [Sphingomonadaceae bacterium]
MKFDMSRAWDTATEMMSANRDVMLVVVGMFVFLPNLALALWMGDTAETLQAQAAANPEAAMDAVMDFYSGMAIPMVILSLIQGVGVLALLSLLSDARRPTVGEALKTGLTCLLPYFAVQIMQGFLMALIVIVPVATGAAIAVPLGILLGLVALAAVAYIWVKFSLSAPALAIEGVRNPIAAMQRSWALTKGNSLSIFLFFVLLMLALVVVSVVVSAVGGLLFALASSEIALIGNAVIGSALNAIMAMVMIASLASIHRQLSGGSPQAASEPFE